MWALRCGPVCGFEGKFFSLRAGREREDRREENLLSKFERSGSRVHSQYQQEHSE